MADQYVELERFTREDLATVALWFDDRQTRRYLGGPEWPARMLELEVRTVGDRFRGAVQTGAYRYLACREGQPVGYIDCGTFDRWTIYEGEGPHGPLISASVEVPAGSIAFAVDPEVRRGVGPAMIETLMRLPQLSFVQLFGAGVEPANAASARCLLAAGFRPQAEEPDSEGMLYCLAGTAVIPDASVVASFRGSWHGCS